jgi:hypothetical protein
MESLWRSYTCESARVGRSRAEDRFCERQFSRDRHNSPRAGSQPTFVVIPQHDLAKSNENVHITDVSLAVRSRHHQSGPFSARARLISSANANAPQTTNSP